jgi:hypothetical protein
MFSKKMLYIPDYVVYEDIPKIIKYFEDFNIAKVKAVQVYPHYEPEYYVEDNYNYGYALIEIDYYYYNRGSCNFYKAIENNKGLMVYDDPLYWEVQFSPFKEHTSTHLYDTYDIGDAIAYTSEPDDVKEDPDYNYNNNNDNDNDNDNDNNNDNESSCSKDDYNYELYKKNYNSFKSKQKAKRQKLNNELAELKNMLELITNKQQQMHALLIKNSKVKRTKNNIKDDWTRRFRIKY